ncbi:acyltransferase family protein [Streptomyces luteolus]|uniref:Acyltransferase n=1 Tax=Streptomyces luteolus TaxID=3043615 RepID=A0ABT6T012_9ACTN|nr:acyltransferase [Streptomyces sp. B-S-A12]MDI3420728.1 acyltransferase [Streptomyces sp. B-S-A12]
MPDRQLGGNRQKLPSLTGLRFFAAALVFCFHASLAKMLDPFADREFADGYALLFSKAGWAGVSFFFILSGFVLAWSARPGDTLAGFYRRRLLKIYPNHVVTWGIALLFFSATVAGPEVWLPNLLLVHSWVPDLDTFVSVNQPSWSLCSELLFYLLFPLLWRWVRAINGNRLWVWFGITFAGLLGTQLIIWAWVPATPRLEEWPLSELQWWLSYNIPPLRLFEFVLGMLMARVLKEGRWIGLGISPALALTGVGYALALVVPWQFGLNVTLAVPLALLVTAVAAADISGRRTGLRGRFISLLGEVSFAFYLVHYLVLLAVHDLLDERKFATPVALAVLVAAFAFSQLVGWLLFVCVERPVMRRWASGGKKQRVTTSAPSPASVPDAADEAKPVVQQV